MQFNKINTYILSLIAAIITSSAMAHGGRRFDVQVVNDKIFTQGYITGHNPEDDGNGLVRDYYNAVHAHWASDALNRFSFADLPGFDINAAPELAGEELWLEVIAVKKWSNAPFGDFADGGHHGTGHAGDGHQGPTAHPHFMPIGTGESVLVSHNSTPLTTGVPFLLDPSVGSNGHYDLNFDYIPSDPATFELAPLDAIYLVEFRMSSSDASILPSDPINAILSPPGTLVDGSHGLSLATERALGAAIPEPATLTVLMALAPCFLRRRRNLTT